MSLWVKICGTTSLADALLAVEAGADAVGFVLASSLRRVTATTVAEIARHLPANVERIGVFVDAALDEMEAAVRGCGLTGVQLHSNAGPEVPARLKARFGPSLRVLRVVHFGPDAEAQAAQYAQDANVDALLVDSRTATAVGGTGIAFDWQAARAALFGRAQTHMVAAGGLSPENVAEAIHTLRPWGVDVVSGVEISPGRKDPEKVRTFVARARAAHSAG
ncbi:MAG TPA: phosphoribosylanthranilate isomerase [Terracidiphilus sp.]|nr:phosphoribosylanthranilate isomerase [Terracidiphilus sp.]